MTTLSYGYYKNTFSELKKTNKRELLVIMKVVFALLRWVLSVDFLYKH